MKLLRQKHKGKLVMSKLETDFHEAMMNIYRRAKSECSYNATYFLRMLQENRGIATARILLAREKHQDGFTKLWELGRLDLTVECLVLDRKFCELFNNQELETAQRRLRECGFDPVKCERSAG